MKRIIAVCAVLLVAGYASATNDVELKNSIAKTEGSGSELAELIKVCNTNGLVHCWRFNGTLKDVVGGSEAQCRGTARLDRKQASVCGYVYGKDSCVDLGSDKIPNDGRSVTIELWATQNDVGFHSRIFCFGQYDGPHAFMSWSQGNDSNKCEIVIWKGGRRGNDVVRVPADCGFAPYELGVEYHIAMVLERCANQDWKLKIYKQDAKNGDTIKKIELPIKKGWTLDGYDVTAFVLGKSCANAFRSCHANASYNEVRVWSRALDEKELSQNAVKFHAAGETIKK